MIDDALRVCEARTPGEWRTVQQRRNWTVGAKDEDNAYIALTTSPEIGYEVVLRACFELATRLGLANAASLHEGSAWAITNAEQELAGALEAVRRKMRHG